MIKISIQGWSLERTACAADVDSQHTKNNLLVEKIAIRNHIIATDNDYHWCRHELERSILHLSGLSMIS
jgi:hypothetical protein